MVEKWYTGIDKNGSIYAAKINGEPTDPSKNWKLVIYKQLSEGGFESKFSCDCQSLHRAIKKIMKWQRGIKWVEK